MHLSSPPLRIVLLISHAVLALSVQIARISPSPLGDNSMMFRHNAYVDSKIRQEAFNILNHQDWHLRKVIPSPSAIEILFASNLSATTLPASSFTPLQLSSTTSPGTSSAAAPAASPSSVPAFTPLSFSRYSSLNALPSLQPALLGPPSNLSASSFTASPSLLKSAVPSSSYSASKVAAALHQTQALAASNPASWDNDTSNACIAALSMLNGTASNPSGISACYNIRTVNNSTGTFDAQLSLYRIAPANGDWMQLQDKGVAIGMAYPDATVTMQSPSTRRRDTMDFQGPILHAVSSYLSRRMSTASPKLLQTLVFAGQVHNGSIVGFSEENTAFPLVTPKIHLAGTLLDSTPISTSLSLQDASFVNGLFTNLSPTRKPFTHPLLLTTRAWISESNTFSSFPIGLLLTSIWSALLVATNGLELWQRIKCRREDKHRMKAAISGGAAVEK